MIQAAIQVAPSNDGSPLGLIIMNPEQLGKKREALTFDPANGFSNTMIRFLEDGNSNEIRPTNIVAKGFASDPNYCRGWRVLLEASH